MLVCSHILCPYKQPTVYIAEHSTVCTGVKAHAPLAVLSPFSPMYLQEMSVIAWCMYGGNTLSDTLQEAAAEEYKDHQGHNGIV